MTNAHLVNKAHNVSYATHQIVKYKRIIAGNVASWVRIELDVRESLMSVQTR